MSLFFMAVGMEVSGGVFLQNWQTILAAIAVLVVGKLAVVMAVGPAFGLSKLTALRAGLLLASGGERLKTAISQRFLRCCRVLCMVLLCRAAASFSSGRAPLVRGIGRFVLQTRDQPISQLLLFRRRVCIRGLWRGSQQGPAAPGTGAAACHGGGAVHGACCRSAHCRLCVLPGLFSLVCVLLCCAALGT